MHLSPFLHSSAWPNATFFLLELFIYLFLLVKCSCLHFHPTMPLHPTHPCLPPLSLSPLALSKCHLLKGFLHEQLIQNSHLFIFSLPPNIVLQSAYFIWHTIVSLFIYFLLFPVEYKLMTGRYWFFGSLLTFSTTSVPEILSNLVNICWIKFTFVIYCLANLRRCTRYMINEPVCRWETWVKKLSNSLKIAYSYYSMFL